ncbi:protein S40-1-like [Phragmites australis]|uniref:protein S40-1-like n=1 Tax=Phragmites australis TaxID=29695 RepID=UPI002D7A0F69|nr:protein S40-1-like [Phragmites australis]
MVTGEELYESDVLWPEAPHGDDSPASAPGCSSSSVAVTPPRTTPARRVVPEKPRYPGSRPVDIPKPAARSSRRSDDDDDGGRCGTMVPPHVLVSRRRSERAAAAFALRSGPGRARELSHLRNSVLRMTGFIEG